MKKSTVDRKYTKAQLAELLDLNENEYTKSHLVDLYVAKKDDLTNVSNPDKPAETKTPVDTSDADAELDRALEIVLKEGILYRIDSHCWWGKTSRVPEEAINVPKELMSGVQTLIDPKHLGPFRSWKGIGERIVKKLGYQFLGLRGVYFVPKAFIQTAEEKLVECQEFAGKEKKIFADNFDQYKVEWKEEVNRLCKEHGVDPKLAMLYLAEENYPSKAQLDGKFVFKWTKFAITVPDSNMGILTDKQYAEEVRKQKLQALEFLENCVAELAAKFYEIISKINSKLEAGENIKPKTLQSLNNFTEIFDKMNITNNSALAGYVDEARKLFKGVSVTDFKEEKFADKLNDQLTSVVTRFEEESDQKLLRDIEF
ncbi:MAG: DUF3150 domain-containing protein [Planctomycetota bacterium]|jgi:hypothetical protein